jgi:hypothetical protein
MNQYTSRTVPRNIDVMGMALGTAAVTVTSRSALNNAAGPWHNAGRKL